ncbi:hypothetical protein COOONC_08533 [Cooperia oncophora]
MSSGHLEKLTESGELDEEEYDRIRSAGGTVDECNTINGVTPNCRQLGFYSLHPVITPRPINKSIPITRDMDYVIIASWAVWECLSSGQIAAILTSSINPQVAAKTIQKYVSVNLRLEKISEVIAKMEDDTTSSAQETGQSPGRKLYERIAAQEKVSSWMLSPTSSLAPPPPDPASSKQTQLFDELRSKVSLVDEFTPRSTFTTSTKVEDVAVASEERYSIATESRAYGLPRVRALLLPDGKILPIKNTSTPTGTENSHSSTSSEGVNQEELSCKSCEFLADFGSTSKGAFS